MSRQDERPHNPQISTIAAIATGQGGGVGIVRVSGPRAAAIGAAVCAPWPADLQSHHLYLGWVVGQGGERIDQVLFCLMRAPRSYTGEDVLEIHGHGGSVNLGRILSAVLEAGAQPAGPGEFTRRAFLSGKLDLTQAEAVAGLIGAQSERAAKQAQRQLAGALRHVVAGLRAEAVAVLGEVEGALDFPDLTQDEELARASALGLAGLRDRIEGLASSYSEGGRAVGEGIEVALLGCTNAGKSSLVNALCGVERVLVDARPGTTRDYVEVRGQWDGLPVVLVDTAGERDQPTELEQQGLVLGRARWRQAHARLLVVDGCVGMTQVERRLLAEGEGPVIIAWNKVDRRGCLPPPDVGVEVVCCSALCGWGLSALRERILALVAPQRDGEGLLVTSARQARALKEAAAAFGRAVTGLENGGAWDLIADDMRLGTARLGEVTGEDAMQSVLDEIFGRFCIGK